jgi:presenilin-like A22 family membrane protease
MGLFILIVQAGSLWLSATEYIASQPPLENPESVGYSLFYIFMMLLFTAVIIFLIKKNKTLFIKGIIYFVIAMVLYYVFIAILDKAIGLSMITEAIAIIAAIAFAIFLYKYPEWYVINFAGLMIAIGACALIGSALSYVPIIVLMILLLIYDFISVYKTKHMLTLANGVMDLKLPIVFVIPRKWNYSYIKEDFSDDEGEDKTNNGGAVDAAAELKKKKKKSDALFMGLGDAVIPTLLVVSANHFIEHDGWISMPALFAAIGTLIGFAALMYLVSKGKPHAGLPFLNTGAILGFIAGVLISGAAVSFSLGF